MPKLGFNEGNFILRLLLSPVKKGDNRLQGRFLISFRYDLDMGTWISSEECDDRRYAHSMVHYGGSLYVFGGYTTEITNDFLEYTISQRTWHRHNITNNNGSSHEPIKVMGHASVVVGSTIYHFFGFNNRLLYTKFVQRYDIGMT